MLTASTLRERQENALQATVIASGPAESPKALPRAPLALVIVQTGQFEYQVCLHEWQEGWDCLRPLSDPLSLIEAQQWARIYRWNN